MFLSTNDKMSEGRALSDGGPMLETLDLTIRIGSTPTFLYFNLRNTWLLYSLNPL